MKPQQAKQACSERVYDGRIVAGYPCTKSATVQRDAGRWYCAVHDPERVKARRRAARDEKYRRGMAVADDAVCAEGEALAKRLGVPTQVHYSGCFRRFLVIWFEDCAKLAARLGR